jgi:hypothetical protein
MPSPPLVIGWSEQLPNDLRAYHLMGTSSDGSVVLSRHGATYSAATGNVSAYPDVLERMLGLVLESIPSRLRERARVGLINQWNRDWGVEAEDLAQLGVASANHNRPGLATEAVDTSTAPLELWPQPATNRGGAFEPRAALA